MLLAANEINAEGGFDTYGVHTGSSVLIMMNPGTTLGDIGHAIQSFVEANNYSVVREYCGHGIGKVFHEDPQILHYGRPGTGLELKQGMTFTIEPMINAGKRHTRLNARDGWTVTTRDGRLSAQWEHTLGVTEDGCEIFTRRSEHSIGGRQRNAGVPRRVGAEHLDGGPHVVGRRREDDDRGVGRQIRRVAPVQVGLGRPVADAVGRQPPAERLGDLGVAVGRCASAAESVERQQPRAIRCQHGGQHGGEGGERVLQRERRTGRCHSNRCYQHLLSH